MSIRTLKVTDDEVFARYSALRIKLVGSLSRVPTTNEIIGALADIGDTHFAELSTALRGKQ